MALKYTARIPSGPYAYLEVAADTADELKTGVSDLIEAGGYGAMLDVAQLNAVRALDSTSPTEQQHNAAASAVQSGLTGTAPGLGNKAPASNGGPSCPHGARTTRNGTNSRGAWTGHFCPLPKGDPNQCKPIFE
jgi:hypothetical protein